MFLFSSICIEFILFCEVLKLVINKMGKTTPKKKSSNLLDILDSDDELPAEYIDLPSVPAYQLDNRFGFIEEKRADEELNKPGNKEQSEPHPKGGLSNSSTVIAQGQLSKKDTFCFQCLGSKIDNKTQEWFLNFLMVKDIHASYTFLTTCLVPSWGIDNSSAKQTFFKNVKGM